MATGWKLDLGARLALLENFPPHYGNVIADHVTFDPGDSGIRPEPVKQAQIVGLADDGDGVEALIVAIDGSTVRPDGGTWHVTWSLGPGRKPGECNAVIARGWREFGARPLLVYPAVF